MQNEALDELMDRVVAEFSDELTRGTHPDREKFLTRVPREARKALERSLLLLEVGRAQAPSLATPLAAGVVMDGFRLVREIGRGGMATVWLAEQEELRRPVALKLLRPAMAIEQRHIDRFRREGLAVASLDHAHIVKIHAVGSAFGYHFIAMEYVEGPSLAQVLAKLPHERPWSPQDLADAAGIPRLAEFGDSYESCLASLLAKVADALEAAHHIGIIHRDVKPSNILLNRKGMAIVADFGLAKADADPGLSMSGDTIGTPWYMSPEQARTIEAKVDQRTDIYSLGVTFYEALAGQRPFEGDTALAVLEAIKNERPRSLSASSVESSPASEAIIRRAMSRHPEARYATAREFADDLGRLTKGAEPSALIAEGGPLRRRLRALSSISNGVGEYKSKRSFLGLPLYHIHLGPRPKGYRIRVAKGWFAVGDLALGGLTLGGMSAGLISIGGLSVGGLFALGGLAFGSFVSGGVAVGAIALGGMAAGYLAIGGMAYGYYAIGGSAFGTYASGGHADGLPIDFSTGGTFAGTGLQWIVDHALSWMQSM